MIESLERIILVTGHYGSGKTNLAVNLALDLKAAGKDIVLCDLDIVNPYFRSADFSGLMREKGIEAISPVFANTNLDVPSLGAGPAAAIADATKTVVVDVGGDDAGAVALGRYAPEICKRPYTHLFVYNYYRYLTQEVGDALQMIKEIAAASRLSFTGVVNNSNLGSETQAETIERSKAPCNALCQQSGLPLCFTAAPRRLHLPACYAVDIYVRPPWEK